MSEPLWSLADAVAACGGVLEGSPGAPINGVSIDTRTLVAGDLFVAIRGENQDGHRFVARACEAGAAAALVEEGFDAGKVSCALIRVPDTLKAMEALGRAARARTDATAIAVTGSVGKTGTKEMLALALAPSGKVHAAVKSYNNHWGVPLTLARMPTDTDFLVAEIGMNHRGEISPLVQMVQPHVAIITTVAPVHIGHLGSMEAIVEAKAEIFDGLAEGGVAVLNRDIEQWDLLNERARAVRDVDVRDFGWTGEHARLSDVCVDKETSTYKARIGARAFSFRLASPGRHLGENALAALTAVDAVGGDLDAAIEALATFRVPEGRGKLETFAVAGGGVTLIDESYNANPASVRAALSVLAHTGGSGVRRIAVLGDMLELGEASGALHRGLAHDVAASNVDLVITCGPHMRGLYDAVDEARRGGHADAAEGLSELLRQAVRAGDVVMIKGSLGSRMGPLVGELRSHLAAM